jgi:hypothetical protein
VNELSFKQHDKREVISSRVNSFTLLAAVTEAWYMALAHSAPGRDLLDEQGRVEAAMNSELF